MEKSIRGTGLTPRQLQKAEILIQQKLVHRILPTAYETEPVPGWTKVGHIVTVGSKRTWFWPFKSNPVYSCTCQWARTGALCSHVAAVMAL